MGKVKLKIKSTVYPAEPRQEFNEWYKFIKSVQKGNVKNKENEKSKGI